MKNILDPIVVEARDITSSIVEMARTNISTIKVKKANLKEKKEQLEEMFMTNEDYVRAKNLKKDAQKAQKAAMDMVLKMPSAALLNEEIKDSRLEIKEKQLSLFDYLGEYTKRTGYMEIVDNAGESHDIIVETKIKI